MHRTNVHCAFGVLMSVFLASCGASESAVDAATPDDQGTAVRCQSDEVCTGGLHCHLPSESCRECAYDADCSGGSSCEAGSCVAHPSCANSLGCSDGEVCDPASLRCRECGADPDCSEGSTCRDNRCVTRCDSDTQCVGQGLLCGGGACVECTATVDCPEAYFCAENICVRDVCEAGRRWCSDADTLSRCEFDGSARIDQVCAAGRSCVDDGTDVSCAVWTCNPGVRFCSQDQTAVETCDDNGFTHTRTETCETDERCYSGTCYPAVCEANQLLCSDNELQLRRCNSTGSASSLFVNCADTARFCSDPVVGNPTCAARLCVPNADECSDGLTASTCSASGSGYIAVAEDCSATGTFCLGGVCGSDGEVWIARDASGQHTLQSQTATYSTFIVPDVARRLTSVAIRMSSAADMGDSVHADSVVRVYERDAGTGLSALIATIPFASLVVDARRFVTSSTASVLLTPGNTYEIAVTLRGASALAAVTSANTGSDVIPIEIGTVTGTHAFIGHPTAMSVPTLGNRRFSLLFTHGAP